MWIIPLKTCASPQKRHCEKQQWQICPDGGLEVQDQRSAEAHTTILCLSQWLVQHYKEQHHKKQGYPVSPTSSTGSPNSRARPTKMASLRIPWVQTIWLKSLSITDIRVEDLAAQHKAMYQLWSHLENYQCGPSRQLTQDLSDIFLWEETFRIQFFLEVFFKDTLNNIHLLLFPDPACQKHKSYKREEEKKQQFISNKNLYLRTRVGKQFYRHFNNLRQQGSPSFAKCWSQSYSFSSCSANLYLSAQRKRSRRVMNPCFPANTVEPLRYDCHRNKIWAIFS